MAPVGKIIAISDAHFGDETQLLDDRNLVDRLLTVLADRGPVSELVLLGDMVDLWVETLVPALRLARYFVEGLTGLENVARITYIPGNHDHDVFMNAFRSGLDHQILHGDLTTPKFMPSHTYERFALKGLAHPGSKTGFRMVYPFVVREANGKEVVFTHGHHLDFFDASFKGWFRTFWLSRHIIKKRRRSATLKDIEMANVPFYSGMSVVPWVPELVVEGLRFYRVINFFAKLLRTGSLLESPRRDTLIRENYDEIAMLLPLFGHPEPGCFVFGHTHRPGVGKIPGTAITVANTGSWVASEDPDVPTTTWVEVEHDVKLYRLGDEGPELMYSESI
jgi:UDP-2,3-diacylglucosamine pyrophosphatase LpxH